MSPRRAKRPASAPAIEKCVNVDDFEPLARARIRRAYFDFIAGGAEDERTLAWNRTAFDRFRLLPRVLVDVSRVDTSTTLLGTRVPSPIHVAPTAYHRLAHPEGEIASVRAAGAAGSTFVASTLSTTTLEDTAAAATGPVWFQLYVYRDRSLAQRFLARAARAGYRALVLTVDLPRLGRRERDLRARFSLPRGVRIANLEGENERLTRWDEEGSVSAYTNAQIDPSLTWETVAWLRRETTLPIVLKGILRPDDAVRAVEAGAAAVWVSNHGGRQLDGVEAGIVALPAVVEAVGKRAEVYVDGGVRRGTDVLKALALGARAAFVGRAQLYGLAAGGEAGARRVLELLRGEFETAMALAGCPDIASIDRSLVSGG